MVDGNLNIVNRTSKTAELICKTRAASFYEENNQFKTHDFIAPKLVSFFIQPLFKFYLFREIFHNIVLPSGMYEYIIARTKYIDRVFQKAIVESFDQIVLLGAGFDSRALRFLNKSKTKVFELDSQKTQETKLRRLRRKNINSHPNIYYIPVDFNQEYMSKKLIVGGFSMNKKTLFILEGLTMYLDNESINRIFTLIDSFSGAGSEIIFDYIYQSVLWKENTYYGEDEMHNMTARTHEPWTFGLEKEDVEQFLKKYHFNLLENNDARDLENSFFSNKGGQVVGKINGTHCIAYAKKNDSALSTFKSISLT